MIKIRYADLPAGLHVRVEAQARHTVIYLLPGLTVAQRRAALHRARSSARMGCGPALPAAGIARALASDRLRTTMSNGVAALRMHPVMFVPPMMIVVAVGLAFVLLASVSIQIRSPQVSGPRPQLGAVAPPAASQAKLRNGGARGSERQPAPPAASPTARPSRRHARHPAPRPVTSVPATPSPSLSGRPAPKPSGPGRPSPSPSAPTPTGSTSPAPSPSPPTSSGGHGQPCLNLGPLGVCLKL